MVICDIENSCFLISRKTVVPRNSVTRITLDTIKKNKRLLFFSLIAASLYSTGTLFPFESRAWNPEQIVILNYTIIF